MTKKKNEEDEVIDNLLKKRTYEYEKGLLRGVLFGLLCALFIVFIMYSTQPIP